MTDEEMAVNWIRSQGWSEELNMTENEIKELAREYINGCTKKAGFVILTEGIMNDFIDLFVAGFMKCLELNKENKWHKVADGDLPTEEKEYIVKLTDGTVDIMRFVLDGDLEPYVPSISIDFYRDVEKWCEIPKFEEE